MRDPEQFRTASADYAQEDNDFSRATWSTEATMVSAVAPDVPPQTPVIAPADVHEVVTGRVKWFDTVRGFGFLVCAGQDDDILLHYNLLAPHGRKSLPEGARVTARIARGKRGRMAVEILSFDLESAIAPDPERRSSRLDPQDFLETAGDFAPVQVRWFNRSKGYGFLLESDGETEIFIHMETVRRGGFELLHPGECLMARVANGPRGPLAVQLAAMPAGPSAPDA